MNELSFVVPLEALLGRELTEVEKRKIVWMNGWEQETRSVFSRIFTECYNAGFRAGSDSTGADPHPAE